MADPYHNNVYHQGDGDSYGTYGQGGQDGYGYQTDYPPQEEDAASDATEGHDEEDQMYEGRVPGHPPSGRGQGCPEGGESESEDRGGCRVRTGGACWTIRGHHGGLWTWEVSVDPVCGVGSGINGGQRGVLCSGLGATQCRERHVFVPLWKGNAG